MSSCDLCAKCDPPKCPKKTGIRRQSAGQISLTAGTCARLRDLCLSKSFMKGEDYYKVPDYNSAVAFLLNEHAGSASGRRYGKPADDRR